MKFWVPWYIDATISAIVVIFFFVGLADGSVSSFNITIWIIAMAALAVLLPGTLWLKKIGRPGLGTFLLLILAIPAIISALLLITFALSGEKFI